MNKSLTGLLILAVMAGGLLVAGLEGYFNQMQPNAQQVALPDIAGQFFTTIIYDDSPESSRLLRYFEDDPILNQIKNRERHNELASTDPYYLENFKPRLKEANEFPIFLIQRPNGDSCLILSKDTIPDSPAGLLRHIRRRCQPAPDKPKTPIREKIKEAALVADTIKKVVSPRFDGSIVALILSALGSFGWLARSLSKGEGL